MNRLFSLILCLFGLYLLSCDDSNDDVSTCDLTSEEIEAIIQYPGGSFCYPQAVIDFDPSVDRDPAFSINGLSQGGPKLYVRFIVEDNDIEYGRTYSDLDIDRVILDMPDGTQYTEVNSGFFRVDGSNYPNPSIYQLYGGFEFDMQSEDGESIQIKGQYSLKL